VDYFYTSRPDSSDLKQLRIVGTVLVRPEDGRKQFLLQEAYKDQLSVLMQDYPALKGQIYHTRYDESSLRELYFRYNYRNRDTAENLGSADKGTFYVYPLLGYLHSKVRVSSSTPTYSGADIPGVNGITGGAGVLFTLPRSRGQFGFVIDALVHSFKSRSPVYQQNIFNNADINLDYQALDLDFQFRWTYPAGKVRPFVQLGGGPSFVLDNKSILTNYNTVNGVVTTQPFLGDNFRRFAPVGLAGAGIMAGRLAIEARYQASAGMSSDQSIALPLKSYYLLASYQL
jgi:hypothetical protein